MGGRVVAKRLASGRREDLLDGVMRIIAERGFADVRITEVAAELHCSAASLYKIAPSKDSLVMLAISRWGEQVLVSIERLSQTGATAADRARLYFRGGAESLHALSSKFREDVERFESTRMVWSANVADPFIVRFAELLDLAVKAGEIRTVNTGFMAEVLRQIASVLRDEQVLRANGLTVEQGMLEIDLMIWDGIRLR
jgi:AcrR family transcriptional regulator